MNRTLTAGDARDALQRHVREKTTLARAQYGPRVDYAAMRRMLDDREIVRYPVAIRFDAAPREPGEFAFAAPRSSRPHDGFDLYVVSVR